MPFITNHSGLPAVWKQPLLVAVAMLLTLTACSKHADDEMVTGAMAAPIDTRLVAEVRPAVVSRKLPGDMLAYSHEINIELDGGLIPARVEALRANCAATKDACSVINLQSANDKYHISAEITLRLAPEKVTEMSTLAAKDATITSQHSTAEELGTATKENEQRLAALKKYREQLDAMLARKDINPDQLIALSRELATTQSQIEELSMDRSRIQRRIDTELLTVRLATPDLRRVNQETPIKDAVARFGANFRYAIAEVISFVAGFIPWLLVLVPGFAATRWLWIRLGRRFGRSTIAK